MLMRQSGADGNSFRSSKTFKLCDLAHDDVGRVYIDANAPQFGESPRERLRLKAEVSGY